MTARDIHYGRRGGRWAEADTGRLADELAAAREAADDWPETVAAGWRPSTWEDWSGRARMAAAKADAGGVLDALDVEVYGGPHGIAGWRVLRPSTIHRVAQTKGGVRKAVAR